MEKGKKMDAIREFLRNADQIEHGMITWDEYERKNEILRDVEPVIRCKNCKCKDKYENFCWVLLREIDPSDYCSYAEGREE